MSKKPTEASASRVTVALQSAAEEIIARAGDQVRAAAITGVAQPALSDLKRGTGRTVRIPHLMALRRALGKPLDLLLDLPPLRAEDVLQPQGVDRPPPCPERDAAIRAARELGYDERAIEAVSGQPVVSGMTPLGWFRRIEAEVAAPPRPTAAVTRIRAIVAEPDGSTESTVSTAQGIVRRAAQKVLPPPAPTKDGPTRPR